MSLFRPPDQPVEISELVYAMDQFPKELKAEVIFSGADVLVPTITTSTISEDESDFDITSPKEFLDAEEIFSDVIAGPPPPPPPPNYISVGEPPPPPPNYISVEEPPPPPPNYISVGRQPPPLPPPNYISVGIPPPPPPNYISVGRQPPPPPPPNYISVGVPPPPPPNYISVGRQPPPPPPPNYISVGRPPPPPPPPNYNSVGGPPPPPPSLGGRRIGAPLSTFPPPGCSRYGAPPPPPPPPSCSRSEAPPPPILPPGGRGHKATPPPPPPPGSRGPHPSLGSIAHETSSLYPLKWVKILKVSKVSLWYELQTHGHQRRVFSGKPKEVQLIDFRRAFSTIIMLTQIKISLPDMMAAVLAMDESVLDVDQIENLLKFCPTKQEMELLKNYAGDKSTLGKCEQYFLELMKVPRVEAKLRAFCFKIQFDTQITTLKKTLNVVDSACKEIRTSHKLKEIMRVILDLGNTMNQGTEWGGAVGFRLDTLLILSNTRATKNTTFMHYLCKVLASQASGLLNFHKDLESLESASKIELNLLGEEMESIIYRLEKLNQELTASESDGPVSDVFRKTLKNFISIAETEVASILSLYSIVERNANALVHYFGEDPRRCAFEEVTETLLKFIKLFKKAHQVNVKQEELEKKIAIKEEKTEKSDTRREQEESIVFPTQVWGLKLKINKI